MSQLTPTEKRRRFRERLAAPGMLVVPGGFSPVYARMAEMIGFDGFFIAGSQTSAFLYGVPDNGIIGLRDMADHARHVAARTDLPIIVDSDTGYGNAVNVHFAVQEYVRAGVAAISLEDQEAPKKSGTVAGRRSIPKDEAVGKIQSAVAARDAIDPEFVIIARCDEIGAADWTFESALDRSIAYVTEGGADIVWLNSMLSREQVVEACRAIPAPVFTIWGGEMPQPTLEEYAEMGLKLAFFPVQAATAGMQGAWDLLNDLKLRGTVAVHDWADRAKAQPWGAARQPLIIREAEVREIEEAYLPSSAQRDYDSTFGHPTLT
jgi:2-methylisocitrate lyase-like PEP mutase family enzyme